jgi:Holliday junction DNA helicase RuvA
VIARLEGLLLERTPTRVVIDVGGVGYEALIPLSTFSRLPDEGKTVALRIHTHVREDALALYGFATLTELRIFERLIGISGIGPKLALAVLSGIEPADLVVAVQRGDVVRLTAIPGVGRKTAERIGLELKDRLAAVVVEEPVSDEAAVAAPSSMKDDLLSALLNLGYHRPLAERAVAGALKSGTSSFESALREALRAVSR